MQRILSRQDARHAKIGGDLQLVKSFLDIDFEPLRGLKVILCDIENTLAPRGSGELSEAVLAKFRQAKDVGFHYVVLRSNKKHKRKTLFRTGSGDFSMMVTQLETIFGEGNVLLRQPQTAFWPLWAAGKWPRKPWRSAFEQDRAEVAFIEEGSYHKFPSIRRCDIVVIGDKFRFDVLRPLLMEYMAILVNPIGGDGKGDRWMQIRRLERFTLWRLGLKRPLTAGS